MKKIKLLLVAVVFVIGIQSCSTEEDVLIEESVIEEGELTTLQQKNSTALFAPWKDNIFVFYPPSMSNSDKNRFKTLMTDQVFNTLIKVENNSCFNKETWDISNYEQQLFDKSGIIFGKPGGVRVVEVGNKNDDDDTTIPIIDKHLSLASKTNIGGFNVTIYNSAIVPVPCAGFLSGF